MRRSAEAAALAALVVAGVAHGQGCAGAEGRLAAAAGALGRGDGAAAEREYSAVQAANPGCAEAVLGLGRARAAQGDYPGAYRLLAEYSHLAPQDARGYAAGAAVLLQVGRAAQADALSAQAVALDPNNVEALVLRGRILAMKDQVSDAEQALEKACRLAPKDPQAHFELGILYDRLQRNGKAAEQFETVTRLAPQDARAYDYLALNLEPLGQFERAARAYRQALEVNREPFFDRFLDYNYGRFLMKMNRLEEAGRHLDRAVELAPKTRAVRYERAKLYEKAGELKEARAEAEEALGLPDPGGVILDLQLYNQLARICTRLGDAGSAARYAKLAEANPMPLRSRMRGGR